MTQYGGAVPIKEKTKTSTSESSYDDYGVVTAQPLPQTAQQKRDFKTGKPIQSMDILRDTLGVIDPIKNFVLGGIQGEISRGPGVVMTSKGKASVPKGSTVDKMFQGIEGQKTKNTVSEKLFTGRVGEIDVTNPRTQGQILGNIALIASPLGAKGISKGVSGIKTSISKSSREKQIISLEKRLILPGQSEKLPMGGKLTGRGQESVITGGGFDPLREPQLHKQIPLFVTKFGKGKTTVKRIDPLDKPLLNTEKVKLFGKLDPVTRKEMGAFQTGNFQYTSKLAEGVNKRIFQKGTFEGQIKQFATGKERTLKDVLKSPQPDPFDSTKVTTIYGQTKAEQVGKVISIGSRNVGTPKTPLSLGSSGSSGKGIITKQETKIIKQLESPTKQTTQKQSSGLFAPVYTPSTITQSQTLQYPPKTKAPQIIPGIITPSIVTPKIKQTQKQIIPPGLMPPSTKITPITITTPTTTQTPPFTTTITRQRQTTKPKLGTPFRQISTPVLNPPILIQPPKVPLVPTEIIRPPIIGLPFGLRGSSGGSGYSGPQRRRLGFIGSMPATQVSGMFRRPMLIYSSESDFASALNKSIKYRPKKTQSKIRFSKENITGKKRSPKGDGYNPFASNKMPKKISFGGKSKISISGGSRKIKVF